MNSSYVYINKYLVFAIVYFFLNGLFLPLGLLYTSLMAPFFLIWLWKYPTFRALSYFFYLTIPLFIIHCYNGIPDGLFYMKSYVLALSVYIFCMALYQYLENCHTLRIIFRKLLVLNMFLTVVAVAFLFVPPMRKIFWDNNTLSVGIKTLRLQMLTYEPSYYSTLFAPIAVYYLLKAFRGELQNTWIYYCLVLIPLALSLSFGVILGIALSLLLVFIWNSRHTIFKASNIKYIAGGAFVVIGTLVVMAVYFPNNVLFHRIDNILSGNDTSFNGRTFDSLKISLMIVQLKSLWFGAGFGQAKVIGLSIYKKFYNWNLFTMQDVRIPNGVADMFVTLGLVTVAIKFFLEVYFFFKTRVYSNYYRLTLFLFIFIYQFTGSYFNNIAEYVIWVLAFHQSLFPEFNKKPKPQDLESPVYSPGHAV
jgi:hypothetical protein